MKLTFLLGAGWFLNISSGDHFENVVAKYVHSFKYNLIENGLKVQCKTLWNVYRAVLYMHY